MYVNKELVYAFNKIQKKTCQADKSISFQVKIIVYGKNHCEGQ